MSLSASSTEGSQGCIDNNINDELDEVEKEDDLEGGVDEESDMSESSASSSKSESFDEDKIRVCSSREETEI